MLMRARLGLRVPRPGAPQVWGSAPAPGRRRVGGTRSAYRTGYRTGSHRALVHHNYGTGASSLEGLSWSRIGWLLLLEFHLPGVAHVEQGLPALAEVLLAPGDHVFPR